MVTRYGEVGKPSLLLSRGYHGSTVTDQPKAVFWHRDLPPLQAEVVGDHTVEATSSHIKGTLAHHDELWQECERDLMVRTEARLLEEIARLGGRYAHVREEHIDSHRNDATGEAWLQGRFGYTLYR